MDPVTFSLDEIFSFHRNGKIALKIPKIRTQKDLSLAYTPGVAKVCEAIAKSPELAYSYTCKGNTIAVVSDGTALLGLGNLGAKASIPVMEGKALLFKAFADLNSWPVLIEHALKENGRTDIEKFVEIVRCLSSQYGGINLEDIAAPECFEVERRLDELLDIPVFHDDQWGTAIIVLAATINYCHITQKKMEDLKVVINGAGAAGIRIADLLKIEGIKDLTLCDRTGVIHTGRKNLSPYKQKHAVEGSSNHLSDVMPGADLFIGVSAANVVTEEMILSMNDYPGIFALSNPDPEIKPELVCSCMRDRPYILATGRSDYPNQINNVLGFPFIFKGALDSRATKITMNMKIAAAKALALLAREKIHKDVEKAYGTSFCFGPTYLIPTPFDPRLSINVSTAVAKAALYDGVAKEESSKFCTNLCK